MSLTTSSWWSTLIPFSRSVLTISKWPSAAALWRAVCPVCNKQVKEKLNFTGPSGQKRKKTQTGHFEARKPVQKHDDSYTIFARFFFFKGFLYLLFLWPFFVSALQTTPQNYKCSFLQALRVFFCKILQKFGIVWTTNYIGMY